VRMYEHFDLEDEAVESKNLLLMPH
jgi:hypothetical protein